ncbi:MAG: hypothetical protein M3Q39_07610 [Actinomycetota bacterium]|nr:hypothetical protein [Actinomycetota bacterium]
MSPAVPGLRPGVGRGRRQVALRRHGVPLGLHELAVGAPLGVRCGLALPDSGGGDVDQGTHPGLVGGGGGEVVRGQHQQLYSPLADPTDERPGEPGRPRPRAPRRQR